MLKNLLNPAVFRPNGEDVPSASPVHHNFLKPWAIAKMWSEMKLPLTWRDATSIDSKLMELVHDPDYVSQIMLGLRDNGFQNRDPAAPQYDLWTAGALYKAAQDCLKDRNVAFVLGKMGHHAHHGLERGFCTFHNGLMAGELLRRDGVVKKIGILDYDFHEGDGTNHIIKTQNWDHYVHYSSGYEYSKPDQAEDFLERIPKHLEKFKDCGLIIYHCGIDPHIDDQVGGWLTTEQLYRREYLVFYHALKQKIPLVWCLGGGYQRDKNGKVLMDKIVLLHTKSLLAYFDAVTTLMIERGTLR